jgi:uracil-DNA glycosylase
MLSNETNAYLDESWGNHGSLDKGDAPLQRRICWLLKRIGLSPREVCASNLIFLRSRKQRDISYNALAKLCWLIHNAILSVVQPRLIIAFGNSDVSPYGYLRTLSNFGGQEDCIPSGHGNWLVKGFQSEISDKKVYVVGLPHLSRYSIIGKDHVIEWLSKKIQT